ncbi:hypothetical protein SAMN05444682_109227 [Parapedobacter indicus]|uniref:Uncharacterized protein n=2 Tax=Parapedobacter indicus TaxID=1477437 RepID=A0A1I3R594_9SPHI|nr:hypothetical protein [Parapedobacter indicus]PPL00347.1 hypothetical protein CLV26_109226 [Parapedobacter indicus]SFJ40922.1 hypothetical protein SAMN05444682_109227 [Parapedobacter indicus]
MKENIILMLIMIATRCFGQGEITVSHANQTEDFIEIGLNMGKPTSKFELINIDTMTVTDNRGNVLEENFEYPLNYNYNNGRAETSRYYPPKKKSRELHIRGVMKYFTPSEESNSYFNLGKNGGIARNVNLVDKAILAENPDLYFAIVDSTVINKVFPDFKYRTKDSEPYRKIDFSFFDIIYAYRYTDEQKIVYFINDDPMPGYTNMTLKDKKTGIIYALTKIKRDISQAEKDDISVEIMIENEASVKRIPFEIGKIKVERL